MTAYQDQLKNKKFAGNVVIRMAGVYFCIRAPDSGLVTSKPYDVCVGSLVLNPTTIDIRKVSTSIATYSFKLVDKLGAITELVNGDANSLIGLEVDIWVGRSLTMLGEGTFDFANYYKLPTTKVIKADHSENAYVFSTSEETQRMGKPIYAIKNRLGAGILAGTTEITLQDVITGFPAAGMVKIDNEIISYDGIDLVNNRLTNCIRGEFDTVPASHDLYKDVFFCEIVEDNPLNIVLRILTSGGGGSAYDNLTSGLAISESLIDITAIETIRDSLFDNRTFVAVLYNTDNALTFIEQQLLAPTNLRFTQSVNSKLTLAVLDKAVFVDTSEIIDENSISSYPKWTVDADKIVNQIEVSWDYDEALGTYKNVTTYKDDDSITKYGDRTPLKYQFNFIRTDLNGADFLNRWAKRMLARLSVPRPEIALNTHIDNRMKNVGDKTVVSSSQIPSFDGTLNFATELEVVSRSINENTGDVQFKLQYTSFTGINSCYIAPSDLFTSIISQRKIEVAAGRGAYYEPTWKLRLFDVVNNVYTADAINEIEKVEGDVITFKNDWTTALIANNFRMRFANYDDVTDQQKRYCFISDDGNDFADGRRSYSITY